MKIKNTILSLCLLPFLGSGLFANEQAPSDDGLYGFLGVGLGLSNVSPETGESRSGIHLEGKGLLSYYRPTHILDIGIGWFFNEVDNDAATVRTKSTFLEGSARYRLNRKWSLGPSLMAAIANDNSFSATDQKDSSEIFLGAKVSYEPDFFKVNKVRINAGIQRDMTIDNRSVTISTLGIQFGVPFFERAVKEKVIYKTKYVPRIVKTGKDRLKATFDGGTGLYFTTNSDKTNREMTRYLQRLGYFLRKYSDEWKKIKIDGHTDRVGKYSYNMDLSRRRALRVKKILTEEGVTGRKMQVRGYGPTKPVDVSGTKLGKAKNRRVEIEFLGLKNVDSFFKALSIIQ